MQYGHNLRLSGLTKRLSGKTSLRCEKVSVLCQTCDVLGALEPTHDLNQALDYGRKRRP
jgi:hypothetical protein